MAEHPLHVSFSGRLVIIGCGSIAQGVLPLIMRHIGIAPERVTIVTADETGHRETAAYGVRFMVAPLKRENFRSILEPLLGAGDFLLNLSVDVASLALIRYAHERGALYLDTCIEPWPGGYTNPDLSPAQRTNYALRESAMELRRQLGKGPTAVITHGANPGLVSHFVKQALLNLAVDIGMESGADAEGPLPRGREGWARLAQRLGVKVIHIAERDTQVASAPKRMGEFVNTWSVDGFVAEGCQPAELGWGTHEKTFPARGMRHDSGRGSAIYLTQPGAATRVRTWTPNAGEFHGFLITHGESVSISDYLTVRARDAREEQVIYRPTVHYAYHPCDDAVLSVHELAGRNWRMQESKRILNLEIMDGIDELGVLLAGHGRNAYWFGSQLSIQEARQLAPHNTATSLQVCVAVLAGMVWAMENPDCGVIEPDEMDFRRNMEICRPYLGPVVGRYSDWTPLSGRGTLFQEDLDRSDPWQFKNVLV